MYNMEINDILKERGNRYGDLEDNALVSQNIKSIMRLSNNWNSLPEDMKETLDMTASKISRILTGDFNYDDNWADIAGYSKLIVNRINKETTDDRGIRIQQEDSKRETGKRISLSRIWKTLFRDNSS
jgi:hypothetical protein